MNDVGSLGCSSRAGWRQAGFPTLLQHLMGLSVHVATIPEDTRGCDAPQLYNPPHEATSAPC